MRVTLKKNQTLDGVDYVKHEEFTLLSCEWSDDHDKDSYYVESKSGKRHVADQGFFEIDFRDARPK